MKKILYLFILSLAIILPMHVGAKKDLKNQCSYKTDDLDAELKIYAEDNNKISTELIVYKIGEENFGTTGKYFGVKNYSSDYKINNLSIAKFHGYSKYNCPRYLLARHHVEFVGPNNMTASHIYDAYVSDDSRDLSVFANNAFPSNDKKYMAQTHDSVGNNNSNNNSSNEYQDRMCTYKGYSMERPNRVLNLTISIKNGKISTDIGERDTNVTSDLIIPIIAEVSDDSVLKIEDFKNRCVNRIYYDNPKETAGFGFITSVYKFYSKVEQTKGKFALELVGSSSNSGNTGSNTGSNNNNDDDDEYREDSTNGTKIEFKEGCSIFSNDLKSWLIQLLNLIKIGGLILTLVLGMFDFFKGVTSGEADAMKKIWKSFSRRLISLIILFLLPLLIEFLFGLINVSGINSSNPLCGIK